MYNWQQKDWPNFKYTTTEIEEKLFEFSQRAGRVNGILEGLSDTMQMEAILSLMVAEAVKTSEIEGEYLSQEDVMSPYGTIWATVTQNPLKIQWRGVWGI